MAKKLTKKELAEREKLHLKNLRGREKLREEQRAEREAKRAVEQAAKQEDRDRRRREREQEKADTKKKELEDKVAKKAADEKEKQDKVLILAAAKLERAKTKVHTDLEMTELGNALIFSAVAGPTHKFVNELDKWVYWDDERWVQDENGAAKRKYITTVLPHWKKEKQQLADMMDGSDDEVLKDEMGEMKRWLKTIESLRSITASMELSQAAVDMTKPLAEFDSKGHFFGVRNGVLNLRNGNFITGSSDYLMMKRAEVDYNKDAECPEWEKFLSRIMCDDPEMVSFLQRIIGQAMFGGQKDKFLIFYGHGANGKSTFVDTLSSIFGDYGDVAKPEVFYESYQNSNKEYYIARMASQRLLLMTETKKVAVLSEELIKSTIDSGEMLGRYPGGRPFAFQPMFTPILSTNFKPRLSGDGAIWRRVLFVPFEYTIPKDERNASFREEVLMKEASGILNWCVTGAIAFKSEGLSPPESVLTATSDYKKEVDKIGRFIDERCIIRDGAKVKMTEFRSVYDDWCRDEGMVASGTLSLKEDLQKRGFEVRRYGGVTGGNTDWAFGINIACPEDFRGVTDLMSI